jgi:hypothetical protein
MRGFVPTSRTFRTTIIQGGRLKGDVYRRITVTLSIFNFRKLVLAQIVENRETRLSLPFLGTGDNFSKSYAENQPVEAPPCGPLRTGLRRKSQILGAIQLPYKSVFVITFRKIVCLGPENGL